MIRIAIAGIGLIGREHAKRVIDLSGAELCAIADPMVDPAQASREWDCPVYAGIDELLGATRPDGLILATPNALHAEQAKQAIAARIPVLVEKPLAHSLADAKAILDLAHAHKVEDQCLVGHHRVYSGLLESGCRVIDQGRLGRLVAVQGSALFYKPTQYFENAVWRTQIGGGPIQINMIHEIGNLRALAGEISEVYGMSSNAVRGFDVEDSVSLTLRFTSGALGSFLLSDSAASTQSWEQTSGENPSYFHDPQAACYHIAGTLGSLTMPSLRLQSFAPNTEPGWWSPMVSETVDQSQHDPLTRQLEHFVQVIQGQAKPQVSLHDGFANIQVLDAIQSSLSSGRPVKLTV